MEKTIFQIPKMDCPSEENLVRLKVFVVMSTFWGWWVDGKKPDLWDVVGASVCLIGVGIIMYAPRENLVSTN
ncbi:MAG: YnfA family protein [Acidobacteriota bacterium]|nr:YnfA family protein [Acidobacteriota bacterium]